MRTITRKLQFHSAAEAEFVTECILMEFDAVIVGIPGDKDVTLKVTFPTRRQVARFWRLNCSWRDWHARLFDEWMGDIHACVAIGGLGWDGVEVRAYCAIHNVDLPDTRQSEN